MTETFTFDTPFLNSLFMSMPKTKKKKIEVAGVEHQDESSLRRNFATKEHEIESYIKDNNAIV